MSGYILGIDIGSGGCKTALLDRDTGEVAVRAAEYTTRYPKPGWAEQDPEDWIGSLSGLVKDTLRESGISCGEIGAVGIGGVTHTPVLLDRDGCVIRSAIHLTDTRSHGQAARLRDAAGQLILDTCMNAVTVMWTSAMLLWIRENEPDTWDRLVKLLFPKDYVRYRLTGSMVTDHIDAEGTLLFNTRERRWDERLLALIGMEPDRLPDTVAPFEIVGRVTAEGEKWSGLRADTPVIAGTTDTLLEIIAAGLQRSGDCTVKLATFGRICVLSDKPYFDEKLITYSYIHSGLWYPGTGTKSFASSLRWFRDQFCTDLGGNADAFSVMEEEARTIKPGSGGLLFHPFLQGEGSPYNDPHLRGDFIGLSLHHRRGHLIRSVLEGTAFSLLDSISYIRERGIEINEPVRYIGGGTRSTLWLQIVADVLGLDGIKPGATDPSIGAALIAGVGTGAFGSLEEAQKLISGKAGRVVHVEERTRRYRKLFEKYKRAVELLTGVYHELSGHAAG